MLIIFKTDNFGFSLKITCEFLLHENIYELSELNTIINLENDNIFQITYQIKVSRAPL